MVSDYEANVSTGLSWLKWSTVCTHSTLIVLHNSYLVVGCFLLVSLSEFILYAHRQTPISTGTKMLKAPFSPWGPHLSAIDLVPSLGITIETRWRLDIGFHQIYIKGAHWFGDLLGETKNKQDGDVRFFTWSTYSFRNKNDYSQACTQYPQLQYTTSCSLWCFVVARYLGVLAKVCSKTSNESRGALAKGNTHRARLWAAPLNTH